MDGSEVTITLPMSGHGLGVILTALGIGLATGFLWLVLREQGRKSERAPLALLTAFGWLVVPVWLVLFAGTLWQVWLILSGGDSALVGSGRLGAGALIAALLGAPFVIWGTVLRHQTLRYQKEGHITERITSAVEQLGAEKTVKTGGDETTAPNIEVRIGAILSLERIAQDSTMHDKGRDHVRVMEILCAYVRENAPAHDLSETKEPFEAVKPRIDIQTALNVIKRRDSSQQEIEANQKYLLDLRMVNFDGCDLSKGAFQGTNCSIPNDHISPRRSALFMARSVLRDIRDGERPC